ncbi:MAG: hypothetical protein D6705_16720 [Deltaproteobacteria bacterium]|nr:MAG: hypothetical protein D6705_16720 [Deltaproteobacteria bacterium]
MHLGGHLMKAAAILLSAVMAATPVTSRAAFGPAADPWRASFPGDVVGSYLDVSDAAVLLVATGDPASVRDAAAHAFTQALRDSGRVRVVMDASALGDVSGLGDAEIVARAKDLPIDRIVVLRVAGTDGAMFTIYDVAGRRISGAAVRAGEAMAPHQGAPPPAPVAASEAAAEEPAPSDEAIDAYERQYLHLERLVAVSSNGGRTPSVRVFSVVYRGRQDAPVKGAELYRILERPDLERKYHQRFGAKIGAMVGGGIAGLALMGVGTSVVLGNLRAESADFGNDDLLGQGTEEPGLRMSTGAGYALTGVGAALLVTGVLVGVLLPAHPVDEAEAAELIDDYNRKLRKKLGIPASYRGPRAARSSLRVGIAGTRAGGGVIVSGRF